jgi:hypothetical protein
LSKRKTEEFPAKPRRRKALFSYAALRLGGKLSFFYLRIALRHKEHKVFYWSEELDEDFLREMTGNRRFRL